MHTYTLTKGELIKARRILDELETIERTVLELGNTFPMLELIWNKSDNYEHLTDNLQKAFELVNGTETNYDVFIVGEYLYSYKDNSSKYPTTKECYRATALSYFNALLQVLAYKQYDICDDLRRVQHQEHADHIQYLLDIGCTEQDLIRYGLLEITLPYSACPKGVEMGLYSD